MNITEFAQVAGVSKAAVSRYFNGGYLSEEKRARIAAAVEAIAPAAAPDLDVIRAADQEARAFVRSYFHF